VNSVGLGIRKEISHIVASGAVLSKLGHHDGGGGGEESESGVPVGSLLPWVVVGMGGIADVGSDDSIAIGDSAEVERPVKSANKYHVGSSRGSDGVVHLLHSSVGSISAQPLAPGNIVGLVVELEDHPKVVLVASAHLRPESDRVSVGHVLLLAVVPVQVEDDAHTEASHPSDLLVDGGSVAGGRKPKILVKGNAHAVGAPVLHECVISQGSLLSILVPFK